MGEALDRVSQDNAAVSRSFDLWLAWQAGGSGSVRSTGALARQEAGTSELRRRDHGSEVRTTDRSDAELQRGRAPCRHPSPPRAGAARRAVRLAPALAARAEAYVYWAKPRPSEHDRPGESRSSNPDTSLITGFMVARITSTRILNYLDWMNATTNTTCARLDGSAVEPSFITGASSPVGIAVDDGQTPLGQQCHPHGRARESRRQEHQPDLHPHHVHGPVGVTVGRRPRLLVQLQRRDHRARQAGRDPDQAEVRRRTD